MTNNANHNADDARIRRILAAIDAAGAIRHRPADAVTLIFL